MCISEITTLGVMEGFDFVDVIYKECAKTKSSV